MRRVLVLSALLLLPACGPDTAPEVEIPSWAKVAPEQIAEAKKHGVPVAFENDLGMRFVLIPAGTFLMGSPEDEEGRSHREIQHVVTITKPFYMSIYEVTNGQYREHQDAHNSGSKLGLSLDDDWQPVVDLPWAAMGAFAEWLSERHNASRIYTLPTERQWEYACRAGTTSRYSWGDTEDVAHRFDNGLDVETKRLMGRTSRAFRHDDGYRVAAPVGSFSPNPWGLYDMHGNVAEWCQDTMQYMRRSPVDTKKLVARTGRVIRGGCWHWSPNLLRSAHRGPWSPEHGNVYFGFRLVSPLPEPGE